jgi:hypothetical protein
VKGVEGIPQRCQQQAKQGRLDQPLWAKSRVDNIHAPGRNGAARVDPMTSNVEDTVRSLVSTSGLKEPTLKPHDGVEVYRREGQGRRIWIIDNASHKAQGVELHRTMTDLLPREKSDSIELPAYGVAVLDDSAP